MIETYEDAKEAAAALLATVKKLMTGSEIAACEWTKEEDFEEQFGKSKAPNDIDEWHAGDGFLSSEFVDMFHSLRRLETTFSREISDWQRKRNMARARKTISPRRVV